MLLISQVLASNGGTIRQSRRQVWSESWTRLWLKPLWGQLAQELFDRPPHETWWIRRGDPWYGWVGLVDGFDSHRLSAVLPSAESLDLESRSLTWAEIALTNSNGESQTKDELIAAACWGQPTVYETLKFLRGLKLVVRDPDGRYRYVEESKLGEAVRALLRALEPFKEIPTLRPKRNRGRT